MPPRSRRDRATTGTNGHSARNTKSGGSTVIATLMMEEAAALMRFAQAADRDSLGVGDASTDPTLSQGITRGVPILFALATEIALKAWQRHDSGGHDRSHHLFALYASERITPASRSAIAGALEGVPIGGYPDISCAMPWLQMQYPTYAETYIRAVLKRHADTFIEIRYAIETLAKKGAVMTQIHQLERVLKALIRAYAGNGQGMVDSRSEG